MKKFALLLTLAVLIIGCSKADPKEDVITKTETAIVQQDMSSLEADKLEAARIEAARMEAAKIEAAKLEAARIKAAEMEAARIKAAEMEAARIKAAEMKVAAAANTDAAARKMTKVIEPSADSINAIIEEKVDEQVMEEEATSKAMEEVVVEEPVSPVEEKSSKGLLFGFGALAAAVAVYFVSKKK
ncbi:hypothetical protein [uncultured Ilyobacter sp.]|uniref:hypothetical protein n=1 Tax=uncultured Ilyobacter sp. TaxID=544433 RepID=UPI0029C7C9C1|nr:hypothetical protein [uncultured Ilyobacter sp.]